MDRNAELDQIKAVYEDGEMTVNGRVYEFSKATFPEMRKCFAFLTHVEQLVQQSSEGFWWMEESRWQKEIEPLLHKRLIFKGHKEGAEDAQAGMQLDKTASHWEKFPEDYHMVMITALKVLAYPLFRAQFTG